MGGVREGQGTGEITRYSHSKMGAVRPEAMLTSELLNFVVKQLALEAFLLILNAHRFFCLDSRR